MKLKISPSGAPSPRSRVPKAERSEFSRSACARKPDALAGESKKTRPHEWDLHSLSGMTRRVAKWLSRPELCAGSAALVVFRGLKIVSIVTQVRFFARPGSPRLDCSR